MHARMMKRLSNYSFVAGVVHGILSPASLAYGEPYITRGGSDLERMRSDWEQVGRDFNEVIDREHAEASARSR